MTGSFLNLLKSDPKVTKRTLTSKIAQQYFRRTSELEKLQKLPEISKKVENTLNQELPPGNGLPLAATATLSEHCPSPPSLPKRGTEPCRDYRKISKSRIAKMS